MMNNSKMYCEQVVKNEVTVPTIQKHDKLWIERDSFLNFVEQFELMSKQMDKLNGQIDKLYQTRGIVGKFLLWMRKKSITKK